VLRQRRFIGATRGSKAASFAAALLKRFGIFHTGALRRCDRACATPTLRCEHQANTRVMKSFWR
jgi:hypothetical protein